MIFPPVDKSAMRDSRGYLNESKNCHLKRRGFQRDSIFYEWLTIERHRVIGTM